MSPEQPIGIFDSGIGGTSIFKEIHQLMPMEKILYLADSKHAPYGVKSHQEIIELCYKNTELLLKKGCKIIVVACNTATTNAIDHLREKYPLPFIGIEPAIKPAALHSQNNCIGILATEGTLSSRLFAQTAKSYAKDTQVIEVIGSGLVKAIEAGEVNHPKTFKLLSKIIKPFLEKEIDYLVLGCTHYPYLIPQLKKLLPPEVSIIDSGKAVAKQTQAVLRASGNLAATPQGKPEFYTNKKVEILKKFLTGIDCQVTYLDF